MVKLLSNLQCGLDALKQPLSTAAQQKLIDYILLLFKWNQAYNLTAIRDPQAMLIRHIFDSLAVAPYIKGQHIIDVGTGAGLPGIPLALALPDQHFVLLDSNGKKTRFLIQVKGQLALNNVDVVQSRVEAYHPKINFDDVIARAVGTLNDMIDKTKHLCHEGGRIWLMKGTYPKEELAELNTLPYKTTIYPLNVPKLNEERHLVCIYA